MPEAAAPAEMTQRVCIVLPHHWEAVMGGAEYQARLLVERLIEAYDVEVLCLTVGSKAGLVPRGYEIRQFSRASGLHRYGYFIDAVSLYKALTRARPDLIYQMVGCGHTGIAARYARRAGATMVWRVTSDRSVRPESFSPLRPHLRIEKAFLEYGIRNADLILAQTEHQREQLRLHYGRDDVAVVRNYHPVPPDCAAKTTRHAEAAGAEDAGAKTLVVWIAYLKPLKNPHAFVRLARSFVGRRDVEFLMIGGPTVPGAWTDGLLEFAAGVPNLRLLGSLTQEEVNRVLERAHLLINTSDYEGFSNTFIQAWLRRVPVASLRVDPDGVLSRRRLGLVGGGEEGLRRQVARLLDEPAMLAAMGERCRRYATTHHSLANIDEVTKLLRIAPKPARERSVGQAGSPGRHNDCLAREPDGSEREAFGTGIAKTGKHSGARPELR